MLLNCGSRTIMVRKYYLLQNIWSPDTQLMGVRHPFAVDAEIRDFRVAIPFQDMRIPLRSDGHELVYYYYHYWAMRPGEAVTQFVYDLVVQCNLFQRCSRLASDHADVIISGEIHFLERVRIKTNEYAHVSGQFFMSDKKTGRRLVNYEFDRRLELKKRKSMNDFAVAASKILFDATEEFLFRVADFYLYPQG